MKEGGFVTVAGRHLLSGSGQTVVLHGLNVDETFMYGDRRVQVELSDLEAIAGWGMNCIRLLIHWDGIEPEPGNIDEAYLDAVAEIVTQAKSVGLYILLDMHQDLYSRRYADGAPEWATLDDGKPHTTGAVWHEAYARSEAVHAALDNFWRNASAPDEVGLQDHYARAWQAVARRFALEPAVVGYDLMNEPAPGADWPRIVEGMTAGLIGALYKRNEPGIPAGDDLAALLRTPEGQRQTAEWMQDPGLLSAALNGAAPILQDFERNRMMPFYARVARAIREVDSRHILFLEPCMLAGIGIPTALEPVRDEQGGRDPQQVYAPHAYDANTDTGSVDLANNARITSILSGHSATAQRLQMPLFVGEWGAYYLDPQAVPPATFIVEELNRMGCSDTYFAYDRELAESPLLSVLKRRVRDRSSSGQPVPQEAG